MTSNFSFGLVAFWILHFSITSPNNYNFCSISYYFGLVRTHFESKALSDVHLKEFNAERLDVKDYITDCQKTIVVVNTLADVRIQKYILRLLPHSCLNACGVLIFYDEIQMA